MSRHAGPDIRITAIAARPGAVERAYIVSAVGIVSLRLDIVLEFARHVAGAIPHLLGMAYAGERELRATP